ncbi:MAG: recombinase family protein, partial [Lachnospiraceae bacterium]|nr:recombinase family protein [Lachnospiraceae bacterium]
EKYIHGLFPQWGIRFISIVDNADTDIKGNKKSRQINGLVNEWYLEDMSENIRSVLKNRRENGFHIGPSALYGYKKDPDNKGRLIIDEEAAEVVRKIFRYCLDGYGAQSICYKLQEEGILTPTEYKRSKGMKFYTPLQAERYSGKYRLWSVSTVKRILSNEMYIGTLVQGRERKISYKSKKVVVVPKNEWVMIPDCHEAIISKSDFYRAQEVLKLRRKCSAVSDGQKKPYPLAGKVLCKDCGNPLARSGKKNKNTNYTFK